MKSMDQPGKIDCTTIIDANNHQKDWHYRHIDASLAEERMTQTANDLLCLPIDATQAAVHTAVQTPINSLTQMVAAKYLPDVQLIDAPEKVPALSPRWHAQQLGAALGAAADIAAIEFVSKGAMPPALIGACYDGLMRPVDCTNPENQWRARLKNAAIGSIGFGTLYGSTRALGSISEGIDNATWKSLAENTTVKTTLAGIPAGLVTTALSGGKTANDFAMGTYTSMISGLGLGSIHAIGERQAVGRRKEAELAGLKSAAITDHLTGLGNRRGSDAALQAEFARSGRTGKPLSVIYGDLDGFKKVNDDLGHDRGDQVLIEVAQRLQKEMRPYDYAARSGGDEFTLVLADTDEATARAFAFRLEQAIKLDAGDKNHRCPVGISLGVVTRRSGDLTVADLQKRADQEMYRTKEARKR